MKLFRHIPHSLLLFSLFIASTCTAMEPEKEREKMNKFLSSFVRSRGNPFENPSHKKETNEILSSLGFSRKHTNENPQSSRKEIKFDEIFEIPYPKRKTNNNPQSSRKKIKFDKIEVPRPPKKDNKDKKSRCDNCDCSCLKPNSYDCEEYKYDCKDTGNLMCALCNYGCHCDCVRPKSLVERLLGASFENCTGETLQLVSDLFNLFSVVGDCFVPCIADFGKAIRKKKVKETYEKWEQCPLPLLCIKKRD